jgi:hypothetical protein
MYPCVTANIVNSRRTKLMMSDGLMMSCSASCFSLVSFWSICIYRLKLIFTARVFCGMFQLFLVLLSVCQCGYHVEKFEKLSVLVPDTLSTSVPAFFVLTDYGQIPSMSDFKWTFHKLTDSNRTLPLSKCYNSYVYGPSKLNYILVTAENWQVAWHDWQKQVSDKIFCSETCVGWWGGDGECVGSTVMKSFDVPGKYLVVLEVVALRSSAKGKFQVRQKNSFTISVKRGDLVHDSLPRKEIRQLSKHEYKSFINALNHSESTIC